MNEPDRNLQPVVKTRTVTLDRAGAFRLFTQEMQTWWPLSAHSVSGSLSASVSFGERAGAPVIETGPDGTTHEWAEVLVHEDDERVVLAWHPGAPSTPASQLDVRFTEAGAGTQVRLRHSGWERYGADGAQRRRDYQRNWDSVLDAFVEAAAARAD